MKNPVLITLASVCSFIVTTPVYSEIATEETGFIPIQGVHLAGAKLSDIQQSPACPENICPGLGNSFYLPKLNPLSVNTGGNVFFKNRRLGDCVVLSSVSRNARTLNTADSMENFISNTMSEADLSGSYKTGVMTMRGSAQAMTSSSSDITTTFHSTTLDILAVTNALDFQQDTRCFNQKNIDEEFLKQFTALPLIEDSNVGNAAIWSSYVSFLQDQGSHIMMQQQVGSRFQQWESSESEDTNIEQTLQAKACAQVEGINVDGGWSAKGCAAYSNDEKRKALRTASKSMRVILGGNEASRANLTKDVNKHNLDAFIDSADQGNEAIRFIFKPIWELLNSMYSPACAAAGKGSPECDNLQRTQTLQSAYEGWLAIGCKEEKDGRNAVYQTMEIAGTSQLGVHTYQCKAAKTGCRTDNDCHIGGWGSVCYCYGPGCIDTGARISGTDMYRNKVRGKESGSYNSGVNLSCRYRAGVTCGCKTGWAGGLPERTLYLQSSSSNLKD